MLATTCLSIATSCSAPFIGRLVDRVSVKRLMLAGAACLALGFAALSAAEALWQVWLIFALLLPVANLLLGQMTSAALVTRWFRAQRGRAMGISTLGTSLGGFIFPLALAAAVESLGWRAGAALVGIGAAAIVGIVILAGVVDRPEMVGRTALGQPEAIDTAPSAVLTVSQILAMPAFWIIALAIGIKISTYFGMVSNLVPLALGLGLGKVAAASLLSALTLASMAGKLACGTIADRITLKSILLAALAATIAGLAVLMTANGYAPLLAGCIIIGFATGGLFPVWGLLVGQYFGQESFGRVLGMTNFVMVPLTAFSSPLAGWIYDRTGSYQGALAAFAAAIGAAILLALGLPRRAPAGSGVAA